MGLKVSEACTYSRQSCKDYKRSIILIVGIVFLAIDMNFSCSMIMLVCGIQISPFKGITPDIFD